MRTVKRLIYILAVMNLISCAADPGELKVPNTQGVEVLSKANYFTDVKVDILFVIDNSGSMSTYQQRLKQGLGEFTKLFYQNKFLDFHIGVVTSDNPRLRAGSAGTFVERKTFDGKEALKKLLDVKTGGSATEKFFSIAAEALSEPLLSGENAGFYRKDAHLAVFFLTDADDQSSYSSDDFVESILNLKRGDASRITLVGGIIPSSRGEKPPSPCSRAGEPLPEKIEKSLLDLEGEVLDICRPDFGAELARISSEIFKSVSAVKLNVLPDPQTIQLRFGSQVIPNEYRTGWTYDLKENKIYFGEELELKKEPEGTKLQITFKERVWEIEK